MLFPSMKRSIAALLILVVCSATVAYAQVRHAPSTSRFRAEAERVAANSGETLNVRQFGATGDDRLVEATTSASSLTIKVSDSSGFAAGP